MLKQLFFRTDANRIIATGHVMRCLSIANAAKRSGIDVVFITADEFGEFIVKEKGFECINLNSRWDDLESELSSMRDVLIENKVERLVVDSYYVTEKYLSELSSITKVAYIDDLNSFIYPVDTVICYAVYYEMFKYQGRYPASTRFLLGCDYAPLRAEFEKLPPKTIKNKVERLLIMTGGSDEQHMIKRLLSVLDVSQYKIIDVICGRYNSDYEDLCELFYKNDVVKLHKSVDNIIDYMLAADVAVSAGGSTLYELCACGTPTVTYSYADNQLDNVKWFDEMGLMKYAGDIRNDNVVGNVVCILSDNNYSYFYNDVVSNEMKRLVDGCGALNIVRGMDINKE